jgi:ABC-2 type transport system permease protein
VENIRNTIKICMRVDNLSRSITVKIYFKFKDKAVEYLNNFLKYRFLLKELVVKETKLKYRRSVLGIFWSLLNPLLMMMVLSIVFSSLFKRNIENFTVYLLTGKIIFDFFSQATKSSMSSIISNGALIKKVYIPKYIFPLAKSLSAFVNLSFSLLAIVIMMLITKVKLTWAIILFPLPLFYVFLFAAGLGLILASYAVFFRDIEHLYGVVLTAWMYFTPLFYPIDIIPQKYRVIIELNPLYSIIQCFRQIVLYGQFPSLSLHLTCLAIGIVTLTIGLYVFFKKQDKFILYI